MNGVDDGGDDDGPEGRTGCHEGRLPVVTAMRQQRGAIGRCGACVVGEVDGAMCVRSCERCCGEARAERSMG